MESTTIKTLKSKGPIRWNAIIPFLILSVLVYLYFVMFFDMHMKKGLEWVGYKAVGAEVNISEFKSSFIQGHVQIKQIQITDSEKPDFNSIELGDIRFDLSWDALLRLKYVIDEIAIEGVQFMSKRTSRGRVAPPEPPSNEPSFTDELQSKAINKLESENENNVLGDTAQFLKTGKFDDQIKNIQDSIASKKMIEDLTLKWKSKQTDWNTKLKELPSGEEVNQLKERFSKIKFKDFSNLDELNNSVKEADALVKEIDAKTKQINVIKTQFEADLKSIDQDYMAIDQQIKTDISNLKSRFKIPQIDAASFAKELFMGYLTPYTRKLDKYKALAQKYLPPKYAKMVAGEKTEKVDDTIQPLPRSNGVTYEFPITKGYPLFWIKNISVSSKSNSQIDYGDIAGRIQHITSNQRQIGQPTTAQLSGQFKQQNISGINLKAEFNNMDPETLVKFNFDVGSYPLNEIKLMESKDGQIQLPKTNSSLTTSGQIVDFKNYDLKLQNVFKDVQFNIQAQDPIISEVLNATLGSVKQFDLLATAKGELKNLDIDIRSSLGGDLERAFQNLLQNKIKEANEKLQAAINAEINKLKAELNKQVDTLKAQADGEIKKVQTQVEEQKKLVEQKVTQAKKEFEDKANAAKKQAEDEAKKKLQQEGQKQLDDLKKKFKF